VIANPIATRELFDILKGKRSSWSLFLYVLLLSTAVYVAWPKSEEFLAVSDQLARKIFVTFSLSQILLVSVLAPIFSSSTLTREKEEETIDILLTSPLSIGQIIRGKFSSAMTFLLIIIASSFPVAAIILPLGGVGTDEIVSLYAILVIAGALFTMIGLICSSYFHRTHSALVVSYFVILPMAALLLAASTNNRTFFSDGTTAWILFFVAVVPLCKMYFTLVERTSGAFLESPRPAGEEDVEEQTGLVLRKGAFPDMLFLPEKNEEGIADTDNPVYKKEIRSELLGSGTLFVRMVLQIGVFLSILFIPQIVSGRLDTFFAYVTVVMCLVTPSLASGVFSQERERDTLELLLTTVLSPRQILAGKFRAMARYSMVLGGFFISAHVLTYLFSLRLSSAFFSAVDYSSVHLLVTVSTVLSAAVLAGFWSIVTLNTFAATISTYVTLLVLYVLPFVVYKLLELLTSLPESTIAWVTVTSPFGPLFLDANARLTATTPHLWHGYVAICALMTVALYRYVLSNWRVLTVPEERGAKG
jgi:ABC-type transport system involved in multi-copper enzyme maturation permease subunit